jgi:hypothetical protein
MVLLERLKLLYIQYCLNLVYYEPKFQLFVLSKKSWIKMANRIICMFHNQNHIRVFLKTFSLFPFLMYLNVFSGHEYLLFSLRGTILKWEAFLRPFSQLQHLLLVYSLFWDRDYSLEGILIWIWITDEWDEYNEFYEV